jgi:hypothetical protein
MPYEDYRPIICSHFQLPLKSSCAQLELTQHLLAALAFGGEYTFGGDKGSRTGSGLSSARIAFTVRIRGDRR